MTSADGARWVPKTEVQGSPQSPQASGTTSLVDCPVAQAAYGAVLAVLTVPSEWHCKQLKELAASAARGAVQGLAVGGDGDKLTLQAREDVLHCVKLIEGKKVGIGHICGRLKAQGRRDLATRVDLANKARREPAHSGCLASEVAAALARGMVPGTSGVVFEGAVPSNLECTDGEILLGAGPCVTPSSVEEDLARTEVFYMGDLVHNCSTQTDDAVAAVSGRIFLEQSTQTALEVVHCPMLISCPNLPVEHSEVGPQLFGAA